MLSPGSIQFPGMPSRLPRHFFPPAVLDRLLSSSVLAFFFPPPHALATVLPFFHKFLPRFSCGRFFPATGALSSGSILGSFLDCLYKTPAFSVTASPVFLIPRKDQLPALRFLGEEAAALRLLLPFFLGKETFFCKGGICAELLRTTLMCPSRPLLRPTLDAFLAWLLLRWVLPVF